MANTRKTGTAARVGVRLSRRNKAALATYMEIMGADATTVMRAGLEALASLDRMANGGADRVGADLQAAFDAVDADNQREIHA